MKNYFFLIVLLTLALCAYSNASAQVKTETVTIGTQVWMAKNLDVDHYRNGDEIPQVTDDREWSNVRTGAWCYYENNSDSGKTYGKLYNWYAVNDSRGLAPKGWHVPSDKEWTTLSSYLGGESVAGGKLKNTGTNQTGKGLWNKPNTDATNETGFSALPGGYRYFYGSFDGVGDNCYFWSSTVATEYDTFYSWYRLLGYNSSDLGRHHSGKVSGFSVRCVKD